MFQFTQKYQRLFGLWLGPKLVVAIYDPRDAEIVFRSTKIVEKADEYNLLRPWLGDSILLSTGIQYIFH